MVVSNSLILLLLFYYYYFFKTSNLKARCGPMCFFFNNDWDRRVCRNLLGAGILLAIVAVVRMLSVFALAKRAAAFFWGEVAELVAAKLVCESRKDLRGRLQNAVFLSADCSKQAAPWRVPQSWGSSKWNDPGLIGRTPDLHLLLLAYD